MHPRGGNKAAGESEGNARKRGHTPSTRDQEKGQAVKAVENLVESVGWKERFEAPATSYYTQVKDYVYQPWVDCFAKNMVDVHPKYEQFWEKTPRKKDQVLHPENICCTPKNAESCFCGCACFYYGLGVGTKVLFPLRKILNNIFRRLWGSSVLCVWLLRGGSLSSLSNIWRSKRQEIRSREEC